MLASTALDFGQLGCCSIVPEEATVVRGQALVEVVADSVGAVALGALVAVASVEVVLVAVGRRLLSNPFPYLHTSVRARLYRVRIFYCLPSTTHSFLNAFIRQFPLYLKRVIRKTDIPGRVHLFDARWDFHCIASSM